MVDRGCALMAQAVMEIARDPKMPPEVAEMHVALFLEDFFRAALADPDAAEEVVFPFRVGGSRPARQSATAAP